MTGLADSLIAHIMKQRDVLATMDEHCKSISARVTSRDKNVSVEVDGFGAMTGLWLGPAAHKLGPDTLATLIIETAQAASRVTVERQNVVSRAFAARMRELQQSPLTRWDGTAFAPDRS